MQIQAKMKKIITIIIVVITLAICLPNVFSLGMAPAQRDLVYEQNPQTYTIKIINNDKQDLDVILSVEGPLKDYVKFESKEVHLSKDEDRKTIGYTVTLPTDLEPGLVQSKIVAEEAIPKLKIGDNYVSAKLHISSALRVNVPYPDKLVQGQIEVTAGSDKLDVKATVQNLGLKDIAELETKFDIKENEKSVMKQSSPSKNLKRESTENFIASFKTNNVRPGMYSAVATIGYDDKSLQLIKEFEIGKPNIKISELDMPYFVSDAISEFPINVESAWNQDIKEVHPQVYIFQNGKEVFNFKGPSFDIKPYEKQKLNLFFNTKGLPLGEYNAVINLAFDKGTSKKEQKISIVTKEDYDTKKTNGGSDNLILYLVLTNIVLIVLFVLYFLFGRKKS